MEKEGLLLRQIDQCPHCKGNKIVNRLVSKAENHKSTPSKHDIGKTYTRQSNEKPWYWEGNVQQRIVDYLRAKEWEILTNANTASREQGKDIVAKKNGKELWVSVKGWPEKSQNTQARHWFSGALFDLVLYKDINSSVYLALGLPGGFRTYENLSGRVTWLRKNLPFEIIFVAENGEIENLEPPGVSNI
jgi:hypothetical protein